MAVVYALALIVTTVFQPIDGIKTKAAEPYYFVVAGVSKALSIITIHNNGMLIM